MADNPLRYEALHGRFGQYSSVDNVLYHEKIDYQDLIIFDNRAFGWVMALDGVVQATKRDEFIYHEMMTHVPLLAHGSVKHVLIIDGGDDAMPCEVSHHRSIETIIMVEIDTGVASFCRQYLPNHSAGVCDDPCFMLVIDGGASFVNQTTQTFDVIISDCTDPTDPGESLFTSVFYEDCKRCLNPGGVSVAQDGVYPLQQDEAVGSYRELSHYLRNVSSHQAAIPTYYDGIMTFAWAGGNEALRHFSSEIVQAHFHKVNLTCRYYNPATHMAVFALPQYLYDALSIP